MTREQFSEALQRLHGEQRNTAVWGILVTHLLWIGALALVAVRPEPAVVAVAFLVIGAMQYRLAMSCHEAVHYTLLFPRWLNELVGVWNGALVGLNLARYRRQHLAHHRAPAIAEDPDAYIYLPVMRAHPGWRRAATWLFGGAAEILEKVRQKGLSRTSSDAEPPPPGAGRHALALLVAQAAMATALTLLIGWWAYPLLWLGPLAAIAVMLNRTRVLIEHGVPHVLAQVDPAHVADADLETVDILAGPLERFVIAPYQFNYHYAHHRIQSIPHYNARALSELLREYEPDVTPPALRSSYAGLLFRLLWSVPAVQPAPTPGGAPAPAPEPEPEPAEAAA